MDTSIEPRRPTPATEAFLWHCLRTGALEPYGFRRNHPSGPYILDFYSPTAGIAVELSDGPPSWPDASEYQRRRAEHLARRGVALLRFTSARVLLDTEAVLVEIARALRAATDRASSPAARSVAVAARREPSARSPDPSAAGP